MNISAPFLGITSKVPRGRGERKGVNIKIGEKVYILQRACDIARILYIDPQGSKESLTYTCNYATLCIDCRYRQTAASHKP